MFTTKGIKPILTYEIILKLVNSIKLWEFYTKEEVIIGKKILSPIREESNPSAGYFKTYDGSILLKDFGTGRVYNIFQFLREKYNLTLEEILKKIDLDFNLGYYSDTPMILIPDIQVIPIEREYKTLKIKRKAWNTLEKNYWDEYFIDEKIREILHISPIQSYFIINKTTEEALEFRRNKDELIFCFSFGNAYYKIYRPNEIDLEKKWFSNTPSSVLMGYDSLPWINDTLIITKGMKELGILRKLNFCSTALQGETSYPVEHQIKTLKRRFKKIYSLMDNDTRGTLSSKELKERYSFIPLYVPKEGMKDYAEYTKINGLDKALKLIKEQL